MSNHEEGRLLNQVISKLDERKVFEFLGSEKTHEFLEESNEVSQDKKLT